MTGGPATLLVVDDDPSNLQLLVAIFEDEYRVLTAAAGDEALAAAAEQQPDLILLDVMMPVIDGFEVCARLKRNPATAQIPIIFVTAMGDMQAEARGLELGAVDYVTKPFHPALVGMRVRNQVELKRTRDTLNHLALTDGLTGIANRRHFDLCLAREHARQARIGGALALLMCDLDHFKAFNDTHGHQAGDDCLRTVALVLGESLRRPADLAARYGGEEFVILLPETDALGGVTVAERIRAAVQGLAIAHRGSASGLLTMSIGGAAIDCHRYGSDSVLKAADAELYRAKSTGRNRVCMDSAPTYKPAGERHARH